MTTAEFNALREFATLFRAEVESHDPNRESSRSVAMFLVRKKSLAGKAVPTLHRCAEFGRMHVKAGQERFPELPRF